MARREPAVQSASGGMSLQDLADCMEDELLVVDSEHRVELANSAMMRRLPETVPTPVGRRCYEVFEARENPCSAPMWACPLAKVMQSGSSAEVIHPKSCVGGEALSDEYVKITMHPLKDEHGNVKSVAEVRRDVSAERELESQILRRHHHLYALNLISGAVSSRWKLDTILDLSLGAALEIINGEVGGILLLDSQRRRLSYRVYHGLSAKYAEKVRMKVGEGIAGRVAETGEAILLEDVSQDPRVVHRDLVNTEGLKGFVSVPLKTKEKVVGVMNVASRMPGRFTADDFYLVNSIGYQIGTAIEQTRLYARLAKARERYRVLLRHALTAQEEERGRIARELHDETSQSLTSLALSLQATIGMAEMKGVLDSEIMDRIRATHACAVHAGHEIVKLMKELRPTLLDELGMATAIRRYAKDILEGHGIAVSTEFIGTERRLQPESEITLFRVAQGAIGNILEHSEAKSACIKVECNARQCLLRVEDDGKGFDVDKLTGVDPSGRGAGLFTMKERVRLAGGSCHVESRPNQGTKVIVKVPIAGDEADEEDKSADSR